MCDGSHHRPPSPQIARRNPARECVCVRVRVGGEKLSRERMDPVTPVEWQHRAAITPTRGQLQWSVCGEGDRHRQTDGSPSKASLSEDVVF